MISFPRSRIWALGISFDDVMSEHTGPLRSCVHSVEVQRTSKQES